MKPVYRKGSVAESPKDDPRYRMDFGRKVKVRHISGTISTFPNLHVMLMVSKVPTAPKVAGGEENDDILLMMNSGSKGGDNHLVPDIDIEVDKLFIAYWAHNMHLVSKDFHANATVYYEET